MGHHKEEATIQQLLTQSVKELCTSTLTYHNQVYISGTVGIRVDDSHVLLIKLEQSLNCDKLVDNIGEADVGLDSDSKQKVKSGARRKSARRAKKNCKEITSLAISETSVPAGSEVEQKNEEAPEELTDHYSVVDEDHTEDVQNVEDANADTSAAASEKADHSMETEDSFSFSDFQGSCKVEVDTDTETTQEVFRDSRTRVIKEPFTEHFDSVSSDKGVLEYQCKNCPFKTKKKYSVQRHMATHGMSRYLCSICGKHLADSVDLRDHIRFVHNNDLLKCVICNLTFRSRQGFYQHKAIHSSEENNAYCQQCKKQFASTHSLKVHREAQHEGLRYPCKHCEKVFSYKIGLNQHLAVCSENPDQFKSQVKVYQCSMCERQYRRKATLDEHMNVLHKGTESYTCEKCGKSFGYRSGLHRHKKKECNSEARVEEVTVPGIPVVVESEISGGDQILVKAEGGQEHQELTFYVVEGGEGFEGSQGDAAAALVVKEMLEGAMTVENADLSQLL